MKIKPLSDRIVVRRVEPAEMTEGGIVIPEMAKEQTCEGMIVAVGLGKLDKKGKWNMNQKNKEVSVGG